VNSPNSPTPEYDEPIWRLYHRPRKGRGIRWRLVASGLTSAEAVKLADGPGDWWYSSRGENAAGEEVLVRQES